MPLVFCPTFHGIIIRGIERQKIFKDNKDKDNFLDRLGTLLPETKTTCYAWALLSDHAHFLFRTGDTPLSTLMRRLLTGYAVSFEPNRVRHIDVGFSFIPHRFMTDGLLSSLGQKEILFYFFLVLVSAINGSF